MTTKQYLAALRRLKLTPSGKATAAAFGLSLRQCQNLAAGTSKVPKTLSLLIGQYLKYGLPENDSGR